MKQAVVIINSKNKGTNIQNKLYKICEILVKKNFRVEVCLTQKAKDMVRLVEQQKKCDLLVIAGGDGSMFEVSNAIKMITNKPKIMYFPSGTVNDFGTSLNIPKKFNAQLSMLKKMNTKKIDNGKVNNEYFNYICAFGPFTKASYITSHIEKRKFGIFAYYKNIIGDIPNIRKAYKLDIEIDGKKISGTYGFALIVNSKSVAGFRNFLRNDKLDDGYFNLILFDVKSVNSVRKWLKFLRRKTNETIKEHDLVFYRFKHLKIKTDESIQWTLDGEKGPNGSIEVKVLKHNLEMVVD